MCGIEAVKRGETFRRARDSVRHASDFVQISYRRGSIGCYGTFYNEELQRCFGIVMLSAESLTRYLPSSSFNIEN